MIKKTFHLVKNVHFKAYVRILIVSQKIVIRKTFNIDNTKYLPNICCWLCYCSSNQKSSLLLRYEQCLKSCKICRESLDLLPCGREKKKYHHIWAWFRPRISLELLYLTITPEFVSLHVKNDILNRVLKPSSSYFFLFFFFSLLTIN